MPKHIFNKNHAFLPKKELLSFEQIERVARAFVAMGVEKIRLTGGEPLVRYQLEHLIERLAAIEGVNDLSLTTNASLLTEKRAQSLKDAGIQRLNISLDSLDDAVFKRIVDVDYSAKDVLNGIDNALKVGFDSVKINSVVRKGINEHSILPLIEHFQNYDVVLRFIEFMDVGNSNHWRLDNVISAQQILETIAPHFAIEPLQANYTGEVAKRWQLLGKPLEVGIISSISQPFCGDCSRARLSAIGEVYTCLFATQGTPLKPYLEHDAEAEALQTALLQLWRQRKDQYSQQRAELGEGARRNSQKVEMSYIGG